MTNAKPPRVTGAPASMIASRQLEAPDDVLLLAPEVIADSLPKVMAIIMATTTAAARER